MVEAIRAELARDPKKATPDVLKELAELEQLLIDNPMQGFYPHEKQAPFFEATTPIVAAFAGNRFGKTSALVARVLIECCDEACLPQHLRGYKRFNTRNRPRAVFIRVVNPSFSLLDGVILPAFRKWAPRTQLMGGSFDKAFQGPPNRLLRFANGSLIQFMCYEQDLDKFGGSALHVVAYDEPPPRDIRQECMMRLSDFNGYELFAMTPLKANTAWVRRDIFKKREHPDITVIRGSIHDNPTLSKEAVARNLAQFDNDLWRQAREFGDFVDVGGLIYPDFERWVCEPPTVDAVKDWDVVVGIDPGVRNAGFSWVGFDNDNTATVFDEALLQDATVDMYVNDLKQRAARWGLRLDQISFVIDPAARARGAVNSETVEGALGREGIFTIHGQNDVDAGVQQIRSRGANKRLWVSTECVLHRDQADEYAAEDRDDGQFKPIKTNDHVLDANRYAVMHRPWDQVAEAGEAQQRLGAVRWEPGKALKGSQLQVAQSAPPMGPMSLDPKGLCMTAAKKPAPKPPAKKAAVKESFDVVVGGGNMTITINGESHTLTGEGVIYLSRKVAQAIGGQ